MNINSLRLINNDIHCYSQIITLYLHKIIKNMRLKEIAYHEATWSLEGLYFNEVSLIVGKNAVGKSKTIQVLNKLTGVILQQREIAKYESFGYKLIFCNGDSELRYTFAYIEGVVKFEKLENNQGQVFIDRNENETTYYSEKINPPTNKLTLNVRRDTVLYPQIEEIIEWAELSYGLLFNGINPASDDISSFNIMSKCDDLITMFEKLDDQTKNKIQEELNQLDYKIDKLEVEEIAQKFKILHIEERNVRNYLWEASLSQGMQRTLFLIVFINYISTHKSNTKTIVIDDFCEGLDYDRTIKLGKYLYNFCIENKIQLITTSNDSFLMDVVSLKYWNILQRDGEKVTAININNTPKLFDDFEFTGLSNFDLFSSDFIARHKK